MAKRRKQGEGTLRLRKDGRWEGRVVVGYDDKSLPITKNVTAKTKTECAEKLETLKEKYGKPTEKINSEMLFGEWIDFWYQTYCKYTIRVTTQQEYENRIYKHIIPEIGKIPLNKLTQSDIQQFYARTKSGGRKIHTEIYGKGLSDRVIRAIHANCRSALEKAVQEGLIRINPAIGCKLPPKKSRERIVREKNTEIDTNVKISLSPKAENLTDYTLDIGIKPCTENNQLYFAIEYNLRNEKTEELTEVGAYFVDTDDVMIAGHSGHLPDYETFRAVVEANAAKAVDKIRELPKRSEPFTEIKANADSKRVIAYLTKTRGLDYNIVAELLKKGQLVQEEKTGNAAFLIKDENGKIIGAEKVGTSTDRRFKGVTAGLPEGYGFETVRGKGEYAYFFESAVDMLSFMQIHNDKLDNARLISMMGVKPSIVEATMERYGIPPEKVYIGADNDEAGDKFAKGLQSKYPAIKRFLPSNPDCKDWNDQLLKNLSSKALEAVQETQPAARKPTELEKKAVEIAKEYQKLPMQDKINVIAKVFGGTSGEIETTPCTRKWRGTSDISIRFDNGISLFIGNHPTPKAKTAAVQNDCINSALVRYNPEIIGATKEAAIGALKAREAKDNEIAAQKGLKPYTLLNVEFNDCSGEKSDMHMGWYYVTLAVDDKIRAHIETGLNYAISDGKISEMPTRENYFAAGALKEADVDYVFNNVGFSSKSNLYSLPVSAEVRECAEKTLAQRREEQLEKQAKFKIFQLKNGEQYHGVRFENFEANKEKNLNFQDYDLVYTGDWEQVDGTSAEEKLNSIFDEFNIHRPEDFTGHSLSISDVIAVGYDGEPECPPKLSSVRTS